MTFREMTTGDIKSVLPFYIDWYNKTDNASWTAETATKRMRRVLTMEDSYSLLAEESGQIIGFIIGFFEQYDDGIVYRLDEILVKEAFRNKGIGTALIGELAARVREKGAMMIQLEAINDEMHNIFYDKLGFKDVVTHVLKVRML